MPARALLARARRRPLRVFYDERYRLALTGVEGSPRAMELRRPEEVLHYLRHAHAVAAAEVVAPQPASYEALGWVHTPQYLESLMSPEELARIFAVAPSDVYVDEVLKSLRLGVGGTVEAALYSLATKHPAMNLFGGFHHAAPDRGAGFCALNDVAVAIGELRARGFDGRIAVLDFDFHPPDGTWECLRGDERVWVGSLSGADWQLRAGDDVGGKLDETVLPPGTRDDAYLDAVEALLGRMPKAELTFVLAGADVLTGDRLGQFALSLPGVRERELMVARHLHGCAQVWLPAGGYSSHAWKVFAGVGLTLAFDSDEPIPTDYDPLEARFSRIASSLPSSSLGEEEFLSEADLADALGLPRRGPPRFLEFYSAQGLEFALERYRVLPLLRRLGFANVHAVIDTVPPYDRARAIGTDVLTGKEVTLVELEAERRVIGQDTFLFINWLSLRNPRAQFSAERPQLPGQEVPGLGLAREMSHILGLMSVRLKLAGVAFRPSWFHMAYAARHSARFIDPHREGRFQALLRDMRHLPLLEATRAIHEGRVTLNGKPYTWEAEEMVRWHDRARRPQDKVEVAAERDAAHFALV